MALAPQTENNNTQPLTGMERRMNIRAFDYWESLLGDRDFPSVGDLDPEEIAPFREHSLLLDFTNGYEAPVLRYVGSHLRAEASLANREIDPNDVPSGTLLSRLTNHYLEILANRAPIGFEAEYDSASSDHIMYRGILLPLSDDGTTINFIYGVVSWKVEDVLPGGDSVQSFEDDVLDLDAPVDPDDAELLELTQALDDAETDSLLATSTSDDDATGGMDDDDDLRSLVSEIDAAIGLGPEGEDTNPENAAAEDGEDLLGGDDATAASLDDLDDAPAASLDDLDDALYEGLDDTSVQADSGFEDEPHEPAEDLTAALLSDDDSGPLEDGALPGEENGPISAVPDLSDETPLREPVTVSDADEELFDLLAQCQSSAADLARFDSRSRAGLYETLSLGYDFHLVSQRKQDAYQELLERTGISVQARAPVTPIIKLIFGQGYDKTRVTEYASALGYADREGVPQGKFQDFVESFEGGIKAMVKAERAARNIARGNSAVDKLEAAKMALRSRRALISVDSGAIDAPESNGVEDEFVLMVARRSPSGGFDVIDAVKTGKSTLESALKKVAAKKEKSGDL